MTRGGLAPCRRRTLRYRSTRLLHAVLAVVQTRPHFSSPSYPLPGLDLVFPPASLGFLYELHPSILRHTEVPRRHARDASISRRSPPGELSSSADREPRLQEHLPHRVSEYPSEPGADHVQQRLSAPAPGADPT